MSEPQDPGAKKKATVARETVLDEHADGAPHITVDDKGHARHYVRSGCRPPAFVVPIVVSPPLGERPSDEARRAGAGDERRVPVGVGLDQLGDKGRLGVSTDPEELPAAPAKKVRIVTAAVADSAGDSWDDLVPRAAHLVDAYATAHPDADEREFVAEEAMLDFGHGVDAAYLEVATHPDVAPAGEKRAAVVRLAVAALAWLAVDQAVRGKDVIDVETAKLDATGRLL